MENISRKTRSGKSLIISQTMKVFTPWLKNLWAPILELTRWLYKLVLEWEPYFIHPGNRSNLKRLD